MKLPDMMKTIKRTEIKTIDWIKLWIMPGLRNGAGFSKAKLNIITID